MWVVPVVDEVVSGDPFRTARFATAASARAAGLYPCNYGDFDPALHCLAGVVVEGEAVVYDIRPLPPEAMLERRKGAKDREIAEAFNSQLAYGTTGGFVTSLGWAVYDAVEDLSNYERALNSLKLTGNPSKVIKVKSEPVFVTATVAELETLVRELTLHGEDLYARKWQLQAAVASAATEEDLEAIQW